MSTVDLAIIGGGPGGYAAALRASHRGMTVAVVESDRLGGVCLNRGCVATKAMLHAAGLIRAIEGAPIMGIDTGDVAVDLKRLVSWREGVIDGLRAGVVGLLGSAGVAVHQGTGRLTDRGVSVQGPDGGIEHIGAPRVLLATGSTAQVPPLPGMDLPGVIDSDGALELTEPPRRLVIVGGGPIGCEWADVFAGLGTSVALVEAASSLLPAEDPDLGAELARALTARGVDVRTDSPVEGVEPAADGLAVTAGGHGIAADTVLVAAGRRPRSDDVGLSERGVRCDTAGHVVVDERLATSAPGVSAIGDLAGGPLLAHAATHEAFAAVDAICGLDAAIDYRTVPSVTYTHPEVASVGLSPRRAEREGRVVEVGRFPLSALGRAHTARAEEGFVQLVADPALGQVLGMQAVGAGAGDLIAQGALAIELEATLDDIAAAVHPHPTFAEATAEAALRALGLPLHVPMTRT